MVAWPLKEYASRVVDWLLFRFIIQNVMIRRLSFLYRYKRIYVKESLQRELKTKLI